MIRKTRLAAVSALFAASTMAGAALAQTETQTQTAGTPPPAVATQPAPASASQPTFSSVLSQPPPARPIDPNTSEPTYSVNPPPDGPSGVYLPAAVLGAAKSAAGCVVVDRCDDSPPAGDAETPSTSTAPAVPPPVGSTPTGPPPADPAPADPH